MRMKSSMKPIADGHSAVVVGVGHAGQTEWPIHKLVIADHRLSDLIE